jgi:preprotein translocase subunit SecE
MKVAAKRRFLITKKIKNMLKIADYIKNSIVEMKKVTWPTKKETYNYTLLVIGISVAVAIFLGALDFIFALLLEFFINTPK